MPLILLKLRNIKDHENSFGDSPVCICGQTESYFEASEEITTCFRRRQYLEKCTYRNRDHIFFALIHSYIAKLIRHNVYSLQA
jgi:2-hydroxy-3-keto-5-methylthiopentenyl-1-phosphate phosphatase